MVLNLLSHLGKLRCSRSLVEKGQGQAWDSELRAVGLAWWASRALSLLGPQFPPCPEEAGKVAPPRTPQCHFLCQERHSPPSPPPPPFPPVASL